MDETLIVSEMLVVSENGGMWSAGFAVPFALARAWNVKRGLDSRRKRLR
jgi:acid phosphatase family membrane protein YuiD